MIFIYSGSSFLEDNLQARPVVLIQDDRASHKSIELARSNDVHLLCLQAHTTQYSH